MNDDTARLTFEEIKRWSVPSMKEYLRKRGIPTTGTKETLLSRTFAAYECNTPILLSEKQLDQARAAEYQELLQTPFEGRLPDPLYELTDGWVDEKYCLNKFPPVTIDRISEYVGMK